MTRLETAPRRCGLDVLEAIYGRRAVRAYAPRPVERAAIERLLDAAVQAPSAVNQQPWAFVVVQDAALLRRISERAKALTLASLRPGSALFEHRALLEDAHFNVFYDAGTLIVIYAATEGWNPNEDCCLAGENLMLAAHGLGLSTCPIGFAREALNDPAIRAELGIPAGYTAVLPLVVGFARETPPPTPRRAARILAWK